MSKQTIVVTDANFEQEVLRSSKPVLVDFWAPWCGPCRMIAPILEEVAANDTRLMIAKLNVDENQRTAGTYNVMSIPTMILFHHGEPVGQIVGFRPKAELLRIIGQTLDKLAPAAK